MDTANARTTNDDEINALAHAAVEGGRAIQEFQREYDAVGWRIQEPTWAKARHMLYHLMAGVTKLALLVEEVEHAADDGRTVTSDEFNAILRENADICARLLSNAAQVAEIAGVEMGAEIVRFHHRNAQRFAPDSAFARLDVD